jgi:hypothetical protein
MTLLEFKTLLHENRDKLFQIVLPQGDAVPISFHITEVGRVEKTFLDCGGKLHTRKTCQLQVWVGPDVDHRIQAGKMVDILERSSAVVPDDSLPLELEYEAGFVSQFPVDGFSISEDAVVLELGTRHTECLAPELCIVPSTSALPMVADSSTSCCGTSGCC